MVIPGANTIGIIARTIIRDISVTMDTSATHTGITATAVPPRLGLIFNSIKPKFPGFDGRAWRPAADVKHMVKSRDAGALGVVERRSTQA
jgi:hypothetical protein